MLGKFFDPELGLLASEAALAHFEARGPAIPEPGPEQGPEPRRRYRTIWISDIHLGTKGCNAHLLIDFLDHVDSETMYLVGDIIDGWRLKKRFYWPAAHNDIVWRLLKRARRGTRIIFIPGNHDEMFRQFTGLNFGGIEIRRAAFHDTADGRRLMVLHGDEFDAVMLSHRWLAYVGDALYHFAMGLNTFVNAVRLKLGLPYWSLSKMAKHKVKNAVEFIGKYEQVVTRAAAKRGVDGVVCGHIHTAEHRVFDGVEYWNDGDWVEGCNALVEHFDGRMEILHWPEEIARRKAAHASVAPVNAGPVAIAPRHPAAVPPAAVPPAAVPPAAAPDEAEIEAPPADPAPDPAPAPLPVAA